ncbi:MAG TPA: hypothetical protein VFW66_08550 [Gemmatimonadales bacterium]|nr:hypothetical protein [Gemmatimonadales bacterium]
MKELRSRCCGILLLAALALIGCHDSGPDATAPHAPVLNVAAFVTNAAQAALGPNGLFQLPTESPNANEATSARARQLALAWVADIGPQLRGLLEREHGSAIDFSSLMPCGRPLYATAAFEPMAPDVPIGIRRPYGAQWIIGLCDGHGVLTVSLAVSALTTDVETDAGHLGPSKPGSGSEFFAMGVPSSWDSPVGLSPERAVAQMGAALGARIIAPPVLIAASPTEAYPQGALWRLDLEHPLALKTHSGRAIAAAQTIYAGLGARVGRLIAVSDSELNVPLADQPDDIAIPYPVYTNRLSGTDSNAARPVQWASAHARRLQEVPIRFELAR